MKKMVCGIVVAAALAFAVQVTGAPSSRGAQHQDGNSVPSYETSGFADLDEFLYPADTITGEREQRILDFIAEKGGHTNGTLMQESGSPEIYALLKKALKDIAPEVKIPETYREAHSFAPGLFEVILLENEIEPRYLKTHLENALEERGQKTDDELASDIVQQYKNFKFWTHPEQLAAVFAQGQRIGKKCMREAAAQQVEMMRKYLPSGWNPTTPLRRQYQSLFQRHAPEPENHGLFLMRRSVANQRVVERTAESPAFPLPALRQGRDENPPNPIAPNAPQPPSKWRKILPGSTLVLSLAALIASGFEYVYRDRAGVVQQEIDAKGSTEAREAQYAQYTKRANIALRLKYLFGALSVGAAGQQGRFEGSMLKSLGVASYTRAARLAALKAPAVYAALSFVIGKLIDRQTLASKKKLVKAGGFVGHLLSDAGALLFAGNTAYTGFKMAQ